MKMDLKKWIVKQKKKNEQIVEIIKMGDFLTNIVQIIFFF